MDSLFHFNPQYSISGYHPRYLLIDSNQKERDSFQAALIRSQASFTVMVANDVPEAMKIIQAYKYKPTMILLSSNSVVPCEQCVEKLKDFATPEPVPIVVYGKHFDPDEISRLHHLGASYFCKSANTEQFTADLHQLLLKYSVAATHHFRG
ncbi:MAG: hypothetical protein EOO51_08155 [Flavobacterium sp.]|nr:MAG: hypothetical protein EOO51_08155 [Flavobacterium sp.]